MKKLQLFKRIKELESRQKTIGLEIQNIKDNIFRKGTGPIFDRFYYEREIPTYTKIKKILEHLGIEIYEKASEIKVKSIVKPKKKGKKK